MVLSLENVKVIFPLQPKKHSATHIDLRMNARTSTVSVAAATNLRGWDSVLSTPSTVSNSLEMFPGECLSHLLIFKLNQLSVSGVAKIFQISESLKNGRLYENGCNSCTTEWELTVTLTCDLWPPKSKQIMLSQNGCLFLILANSLQASPTLCSQEWDRRTTLKHDDLSHSCRHDMDFSMCFCQTCYWMNMYMSAKSCQLSVSFLNKVQMQSVSCTCRQSTRKNTYL